MRKLRAMLARSQHQLQLQRALNAKIVAQMNAASLAFLERPPQPAKAAAGAQTDSLPVSTAHLQLIIDRQQIVINGLAEDVDVCNRRRFAAEEMLYRSNLPKLKSTGW